MTSRERAAFTAGIQAARQAAMTTAVTIEVRDDAREVRHQAAVAALTGLAEGLRVAFLETSKACSLPDLNRAGDLPDTDVPEPDLR